MDPCNWTDQPAPRTGNEEDRFPGSGQGGSRHFANDLDGCFERDVLTLLDPMYRAAVCMTGSPAVSEELVLETFGRAYIGFREMLPGTDRKLWLYRILAGTYIDFRREQYSHPSGNRWQETDPDHHPTWGEAQMEAGYRWSEQQAADHLPQPAVRAALHAMPQEHLFAVYLSAIEGFTEEEIASIVDMPIGTVLTWLSQGADRGFHQRVVVGVADGADRGRDAHLVQVLGERERRVLRGLNRSSQHRLPGPVVDARGSTQVAAAWGVHTVDSP
ncbi:sigma factor-like helix-turn-helix DNA-binding protein [Streptomyces sp. NPDC006539]|uniref:sigma factor-like helix-turn-helix DNA-binding protein n=1 Tax=Streptomyces sp. NPDC006539 TaxID=3155352 RepID=UPI0033BA3DE5